MMENNNLIKNIDQIFGQFVTDQKILNYNIKRLTAPGENYGSVMMAIEINKPEKLHVVAKLVPQNEFIQKFFHTSITFKKEVGFYSVVLPNLHKFIQEKNLRGENLLEFFPKMFGYRLSLNSEAQEPDSDAVLVLEDLKIQNYQTLDRTVGFDLDETELLLADLAELHATSIAFKLAKPKEFRDVILPFAERFPVFGSLQPKTTRILRDKLLETVKKTENGSFNELDLFKLEKAMERQDGNLRKERIEIREPFATLIHNDYWVNNTMILYENCKPVKNKMVDFQILEYGSPARDLIFFLFSSVKIGLLKNNYESFVRFYYQNFVNCLNKFDCDVSKFTFKLLLDEIDFEARNVEFFHNLIMLGPIWAKKNTVKHVVEIDEGDLMLNYLPSELRDEKLVFIVKEFLKRNWI